jgi:hypothetical protein
MGYLLGADIDFLVRWAEKSWEKYPLDPLVRGCPSRQDVWYAFNIMGICAFIKTCFRLRKILFNIDNIKLPLKRQA